MVLSTKPTEKRMRRVFQVSKAFLVCLTATTIGCGAPQLIPTPSLFVGSEENPFADVPEAFQSNKVDVLYVTDRRPITEEGGGEEQEKIRYDWGRSLSLAFGSAMVEFGEDVPWETLVVESRTDDRSLSLPVVVSEISERGRFPDTPMAVVRNDTGGMSPDPQALIRHTNVVEQFHRELNARLALTPKKEAYIYVHGYNNSFDDAVTVMAQLWHFLGRQGIPIAYTWPAGVGGLRGYFYDRGIGGVHHLPPQAIPQSAHHLRWLREGPFRRPQPGDRRADLGTPRALYRNAARDLGWDKGRQNP